VFPDYEGEMTTTANRHFGLRVLTAAVVLAGAATAASAVTLYDRSPDLGSTIYYNNLNSGTQYTPNATTPSLGGSGGVWRGTNLTSTTASGSTFNVYCLDPKNYTSWGNNVYSTASLNNFLNVGSTNTDGYANQMASSGYSGLAYTAQNGTTVRDALVSLFSHAYNDSLSDASGLKAAAFSYAIWEIMGESSYNRQGGALRSSGSNSTAYAVGNASRDSLEVQIDAYLSALTNNSWAMVNGANLLATSDFTYTVYYDPAPHSVQNFLQVTPVGTGLSVPEPGTLLLSSLALLGAVRVSRRRAQGD